MTLELAGEEIDAIVAALLKHGANPSFMVAVRWNLPDACAELLPEFLAIRGPQGTKEAAEHSWFGIDWTVSGIEWGSARNQFEALALLTEEHACVRIAKMLCEAVPEIGEINADIYRRIGVID